MTVEIDADRVLADLRELRRIGALESGVQRLAFGPDDRRAREWLLERFTEAGLEARIDGVGNVFGRWPRARRAVLVGSHSDTVPRGGWLDGALGVVAAVEVARALREVGVPDGAGVDLVSFADEEGTFRGTLGSTVFCGDIGDAELDDARDATGRPLRDALAEAGWAGRELARLDAERHHAFAELHIEQGPRLEAAGVPIGVVTAIVSMRRLAVDFHGRADHAGTTPMSMRRDAGAAAIRFAARALDLLAQRGGPDTVWNIGHMALEPGAGNVVPSRAMLLIEHRDVSDERLSEFDEALAQLAAAAGAEHGCTHSLREVVHLAGVEMDPDVVEAVQASARELGVQSMPMTSGAGHDAMIIGRHIPAGMVFVPSIDGRSHDVAEDTREEDLVTGVRVLARAVQRLLNAETPVKAVGAST
jgi:beta-ureidopropionase / N-carbamoyl-L-amino-acid hydrolase